MGVACPQVVWNSLGGVSRVLHGLGECGMVSRSGLSSSGVGWPQLVTNGLSGCRIVS